MAALPSTSATPESSHACNAPICAAQMSGPVPPGPAPTISVLSMTLTPSAQDLDKDSANLFDDVVVDRIRGGQVHAGARQGDAVVTPPRVALVDRQFRQRMEERANLDFCASSAFNELRSCRRRNLDAHEPGYRLIERWQRRRKRDAGNGGKTIAIALQIGRAHV